MDQYLDLRHHLTSVMLVITGILSMFMALKVHPDAPVSFCLIGAFCAIGVSVGRNDIASLVGRAACGCMMAQFTLLLVCFPGFPSLEGTSALLTVLVLLISFGLFVLALSDKTNDGWYSLLTFVFLLMTLGAFPALAIRVFSKHAFGYGLTVVFINVAIINKVWPKLRRKETSETAAVT